MDTTAENNEASKLSFTERLKQKAMQQKNYGHEQEQQQDMRAHMAVRDCPNCGAARAETDGLTHCAYCGFQFIGTQLDNGIYIQQQNNSQQ